MTRVALAGNPNSGKTTVFNALTGKHQKIANYAGVTIEKKEGVFTNKTGSEVLILDLPGTYSLEASSPEEFIVQEVLLGLRKDTEKPDVIVIVIDADNLERNLYLTLQLKETGMPIIIALNMMDIAKRHQKKINVQQLEKELGVCVIPMIARSNEGIKELKKFLEEEKFAPTPSTRKWKLSIPLEELCERVSQKLKEECFVPEKNADFYARGLLRSGKSPYYKKLIIPESVKKYLNECHKKLFMQKVKFGEEEITARYQWIESVLSLVMDKPKTAQPTWSDKLDKIFLHKVFGPLIFLTVIAFMFQSIFTWASIPMNAIDSLFGWTSEQVRQFVPAGSFQDLLSEGVIGGVGSVIIFLPQILLVFLFIGFLEDTGYMARAAFLVDRLMSKAGLSGKSFIPLLSSFACAIPGVMACRTIENSRDRLTTLLVAPLMTCSARLPVYILLIGAFIPAIPIVAGISLPGLTMFSLYFLGVLGATAMAWLFKKTLFRGETPPLFLELPTYKLPQGKIVLRNMWNRSKMFVKRAGTIILGVSIVLWFLSSYPKNPELKLQLEKEGVSQEIISSELLKQSYAGKLGQILEPVIKPLGFDWKIGIGLIASFAAREVLVSTMATIYQVQGANEESVNLREALQKETNFSPLVALSLLVFFVFACQCMSTIAIVRRETNSWRWPIFMLLYMTTLAYGASLIVYQGGKFFGLG